MMKLLAIPFHDWKKCEREGFRTRDAHFMQEFGRNRHVEKMLVVNRPISLAERLLLGRSRHPRQATVIHRQGNLWLCQVAEKIFTLDITLPDLIRPLWLRRHWTPRVFGQPVVRQAVLDSLAFLGMESDYALYTAAPLFVPLVRHLRPAAWAFDAQDNLLKHPFYRTTPHLADYYTFALRHADFISANSEETTTWFQQTRPDAQWIANGVDNAMFRPDHALPVPAELQHLPRPIIGYAGKMQEMVDLTLLQAAITRFPTATFYFIGQQLNRRWVKPLWKYPNVHYGGDKPYPLLPRYLAAFDIGIIPYSVARQHGGDPIKFYEYLAMGKPVVTTNIGGVGRFAGHPLVRVVEDAAGFVAALEELMAQKEGGISADHILPLAPEHLWETKAAQIVRALADHTAA